MVAAFAPFGARRSSAAAAADASIRRWRSGWRFSRRTEEKFGAIFDTLAQAAPIAEGVTSTTVTIAGGGGNDLTLYVSRPADTDGPLPGVVHLHGGGMVFLAPPTPCTCGGAKTSPPPALSWSAWSSATPPESWACTRIRRD